MYLFYFILFCFVCNFNNSFIILNEELITVLSLLILFLTIGLFFRSFLKSFFFNRSEKIIILFLFNILVSKYNLNKIIIIFNSSFSYLYGFLLNNLFLSYILFYSNKILLNKIIYVYYFSLLYKLLNKIMQIYIYLKGHIYFKNKFKIKKIKHNLNYVKLFLS